MSPRVFIGDHAVGENLVEAEFAQDGKGPGRGFHQRAALQDIADGFVFCAGASRPVDQILADIDHRLVRPDLARAYIGTGPAQEAEVDCRKDIRSCFDSAFRQRPGNGVFPPCAGCFDAFGFKQGACGQAGPAPVAQLHPVFCRRQ